MNDTTTGSDDKTVALEIPGNDRTFALTGSEHDRSVIAAIEASGGHYEPHLMKRIQAILGPEAVSLDVGANIGALTIAMALASPKGHVHCFEAAPSNFRRLQLNLATNEMTNVTAENLAVYDQPGRLEISYVDEVAGCSFISPAGVREGRTESVEAIALDAWGARGMLSAGTRLELIKLDVEGSERRAILGALQTIRAHRPCLLVEFNPTTAERFFEEDPRELYDLLTAEFQRIEQVEPESGSLAPIDSYDHLLARVEQAGGWLDLECHP